MSSLVSVNVGLPRDVEWQGRVVHTAIWKRPVSGRVQVRRLNIEGDGQGDLAGHGGEHRAVMVYQLDSYRYWEKVLGRYDLDYGCFGENLTVEGLPDHEVCIGDRYRIGSALFEVTQPRVTCYRVGLRMNHPQMPSLLVAHRRPGFYFRVIEEGGIGAGDVIRKETDGPEGVTVAEVDALLYLPGHPKDGLRRALLVPALSDGWKQSLEALVRAGNQAGNVGLAPPSAPLAWDGFRPLRVEEVHRESVDVLSFVLQSMDRAPLPPSLPGQFLVFRIESNHASGQLLRSYSISSAKGEGTYRISVKRASGEGSHYFHESVKAGDVLQVSAPRGKFTLSAGTNPVVLLSAGIGVTPVLAILHSLAAGVDTPREVWWCYGARNGREHPFAVEVQEMLGRIPQSHSHIVYSKPEEGDRPGQDFDAPGHLNISSLQRLGVPQSGDFYLCGPSAFLTENTAGFRSWGVPDCRIHLETFGSESSITPGVRSPSLRTPHVPTGLIGSGPKVSFVRSMLTVPWDSKFGTLLEFAEACDVPVRWSCRAGVCHTCESGLIGGSVGYAPEPIDRPSAGNVLICCSAPSSDIELDL